LDRIAYTGLIVVAPLFMGDVDRIAPFEAIAGIPPAVPVLILAGGSDRLAYPAEALHSRVRSHGRLVVGRRAHGWQPPTVLVTSRATLGALKLTRR